MAKTPDTDEDKTLRAKLKQGLAKALADKSMPPKHHFGLVAGGMGQAKLIVSPQAVSDAVLAKYQKAMGGGKIFKGKCGGDEEGLLVFYFKKSPPAVLLTVFKNVLRDQAKFAARPRLAVLAAGPGEEEEGKTRESEAEHKTDGNKPRTVKKPTEKPTEKQGGESREVDETAIAAKIKKCHVKWQEVFAKVQSQLKKLETAILSEFGDHEELPDLKGKLRSLDRVLGSYATSLESSIRAAADAKDADARKSAQQTAAKIASEYAVHVSADPFCQQLDENPFVPLKLTEQLPTILKKLSAALAR